MKQKDAEGLVEEFTTSPEFSQICIEIRRRLVTQSLKRTWLKQRLLGWIEQCDDRSILAKDKEALYKKLYIAAMEAISQRTYMPEEPKEEEVRAGASAVVFECAQYGNKIVSEHSITTS